MSDDASSPRRQRWMIWIVVFVALLLTLLALIAQFALPVAHLHLAVERLKAVGVDDSRFNEQVFPDWQAELARRVYGRVNLTAPAVLDFSKIPVRDDDLEGIGAFPTLVNLDLSGQPITARGLGHARHSSIKWLTISGTHIGSGNCRRPAAVPADRQAAAKLIAATLGSLRNLEALTASDTPIADDDLVELPKLSNLEVLMLDDTCLTSRGMVQLGAVSELKFLHLSRTGITDLGLKEFRRNSKLQDLVLNGTQVTGSGFADYSGHSLQTLYLDDAKVDDAGLRQICRLQQLVKLRLSRCRVTDQSCTSLLSLNNLQDLCLHGCQITDEAMTTICKIDRLLEVDLADTRVSAKGIARLKVLHGLLLNRTTARFGN